MIKLHQSAKLPLNVIKGSYKERVNFARALNEKFYDQVTKKFVQKDVSAETFANILKKICNNKIVFKIIDSSNTPHKGATYLSTNPENSEIADRYNILLPLNRYDKKISINDTSVFMHEFFHFFCGITNPKHNTRIIKMYEKGLFEKTDAFYNKFLYAKTPCEDEKLEKTILPEFLKSLSDSDKVDFLQSCRYRLLEELNAYKDGNRYYDKIQDEHSDLIHEKFDSENGDSYKFSQKITMIENMLKRVLKDIKKRNF